MDQSKPSPVGWIISIIIAISSIVLSAYTSYNVNDKVLSGKVIALETQQKNDAQRMQSIDDTLLRIDTKLDKIRDEIAAINSKH